MKIGTRLLGSATELFGKKDVDKATTSLPPILQEERPTLDGIGVNAEKEHDTGFSKRKHILKKRSIGCEYTPVAKKKSKQTFCICNKPDDGNQYWGCDKCDGWFHPSCVGEKKEPKSFICPSCKQKDRFITVCGKPLYIEEFDKKMVNDLADDERQANKNYQPGELQSENNKDNSEEMGDDEDDANLEESFLFTEIKVTSMIDIARQRVRDIISGRYLNEPWMSRHLAFRRGGRALYKGYGYSWFSLQAVHFIQKTLLAEFFTDRTERAYTFHGRVLGMEDKEMNGMFEKDPYLARVYITEVCLIESLAAILSKTLDMSYKKADSLLREVENKSLNEAIYRGLEKNERNKTEWSAQLNRFMFSTN